MSGGGGDQTNWALVSEMQNMRNANEAEARRVAAIAAQKAADEEAKRVATAKSGGLSAFATNSYIGYRMMGGDPLGGGNSVSQT